MTLEIGKPPVIELTRPTGVTKTFWEIRLELIASTLARTGRNIRKTSRLLKLSEKTIYRAMLQLGWVNKGGRWIMPAAERQKTIAEKLAEIKGAILPGQVVPVPPEIFDDVMRELQGKH